jgi:ParB-like chromosome segregation protein Spo0J
VIDETDMVLAGHARLAACKLLGMNLVPTTRVTGLNDTQKRAFALADNKIAENAGWDREILALELGELAELLPALNWDLTLTGFEPAELDLLLTDHGESKPDPATKRSSPGDPLIGGARPRYPASHWKKSGIT